MWRGFNGSIRSITAQLDSAVQRNNGASYEKCTDTEMAGTYEMLDYTGTTTRNTPTPELMRLDYLPGSPAIGTCSFTPDAK